SELYRPIKTATPSGGIGGHRVQPVPRYARDGGRVRYLGPHPYGPVELPARLTERQHLQRVVPCRHSRGERFGEGARLEPVIGELSRNGQLLDIAEVGVARQRAGDRAVQAEPVARDEPPV